MLKEKYFNGMPCFFTEQQIQVNFFSLIDSPDSERIKKEYRSKRIAHRFVKFLAYTGQLDHLFRYSEIKAAKKGDIPEEYDVHHIVPRSLGGTNSFDNLCLIQRNVHHVLHRFFWDQVCEAVSDKGEKGIVLPKHPAVFRWCNLRMFFTGSEKEEIQLYLMKRDTRIKNRLKKAQEEANQIQEYKKERARQISRHQTILSPAEMEMIQISRMR